MMLLRLYNVRTLRQGASLLSRARGGDGIPVRCKCSVSAGLANARPSWSRTFLAESARVEHSGQLPIDATWVRSVVDATSVVKVPMMFSDAIGALDQITCSPAHDFWPLQAGLTGISDEIRRGIVGHNQLTDAVLLDLAIRRGGRLATFDRRVVSLLPPDSELRKSVAVIPV